MEKNIDVQIETIYRKLSDLKSQDYLQVRIDLITLIKLLLSNHSRMLRVFLYRVDVDEEKIVKLFNTRPLKNLAEKIADLIINRELQKSKFRQQVKNKSCDSWSF